MRSLPGARQHLDEAVVGAVEDRAVEVGKIIARDLVGDPAFARFLLVEADAGDLRIGIDDHGKRWQRRLRGREGESSALIAADAVSAGRMGELQPADHVACGEDGGDSGAQPLVDDEPPAFDETQLLEPETARARPAADSDEHAVEGDLAPVGEARPPTLGPRERSDGDALDHRDAIGGQRRTQGGADLLVLERDQSRRVLDQDHPRAEPRERLREFAADRAAADDEQPFRPFGQPP